MADHAAVLDSSKAIALRGRLLIVTAAVLWSTSGLLIKSPPLQELPEPQRGPLLACYRALFATAALLPLVRLRAVRWRPMLVPMVGSFASMNLLFVTAMTMTTAAAAIFLQYTSTVWAFLFGIAFLGERADRGNLLALVCAVAGIAWIVGAGWRGEHFTGNLVALGSGISYAGVILCLRALRSEDSAWLIALNHALAGLVLLPWVLAAGIELSTAQWALVALLGVGQMALPYFLFARGLRSVTAPEAALLCLLEPVLNPAWAWLFWREPAPPSTWAGGGLILAGLAARYVLFPPQRPPAR